MLFLYWEVRGGFSTPRGVSWLHSRGTDSALLTCWPYFSFSVAQDKVCFKSLQELIAGSYQTFHLPVSLSPSLQNCCQSVHSPVSIKTGDYSDPGTRHCTWPWLTSQGSHSFSFQAYQDPSNVVPLLELINCANSSFVSSACLLRLQLSPAVHVTN